MRKISATRNAVKHLGADTGMRKLISRYGNLSRKCNTNLFEALCESIIAQQISTKAYVSIKDKLLDNGISLNIPDVLSTRASRLRKCSVPPRKIKWIKSAAAKFKSGEIDEGRIRAMSDSDAVFELMKLDGVGKWTAEMLLIFSFGRADILSYGDFGIRKGLCTLYGLENINRRDFEKFRKKFSPYCTIASLYLWALAGDLQLPRKQKNCHS